METNRDACWYCGGRLIWQNDYDLEDISGTPGIYTELICSKCGARVSYELSEEAQDGQDWS